MVLVWAAVKAFADARAPDEEMDQEKFGVPGVAIQEQSDLEDEPVEGRASFAEEVANPDSSPCLQAIVISWSPW